MKIAILGAGAGGFSAAVELSAAGHHVRLWNRSSAALEPVRSAGGIAYSGQFGEGFTPLQVITSDLPEVARGADALMVCLPTFALGSLAAALAEAGIESVPVILNPGHTGGALEFAHVFRSRGRAAPPTVELSTLTYVARKPNPGAVVTTGRAKSVRGAALPGGGAALDAAHELYPTSISPAENVLATSLSNVNLVLHPPGAVLGAAWIESTKGDFTFYVEGLTEGVARVMERLDGERRAVAMALGQQLPSLFEEMRDIGTIESHSEERAGLAAAIRGGAANRRIRGPDSLQHRYFREDFWYGLKPFLCFAEIAGVDVPIASALWKLGETLVGPDAPDGGGRAAAQMGIAGMSRSELVRSVTEAA